MTQPADIARAVKPYREAWKRRVMNGTNGPLELDPRFRESFRRLFTIHGYGDEDVGTMLGVPRERVRQLRAKLGIEKRRTGSQYREFDWERLTFRVFPRRGPRRRRGVRSRQAWDLFRGESQRKAEIEQIRACGRALGRAPCFTEVFPGTPIACIAYHWRRGGLSYKAALDRAWRVAGYDVRPDGRCLGT